MSSNWIMGPKLLKTCPNPETQLEYHHMLLTQILTRPKCGYKDNQTQTHTGFNFTNQYGALKVLARIFKMCQVTLNSPGSFGFRHLPRERKGWKQSISLNKLPNPAQELFHPPVTLRYLPDPAAQWTWRRCGRRCPDFWTWFDACGTTNSKETSNPLATMAREPQAPGCSVSCFQRESQTGPALAKVWPEFSTLFEPVVPDLKVLLSSLVTPGPTGLVFTRSPKNFLGTKGIWQQVDGQPTHWKQGLSVQQLWQIISAVGSFNKYCFF